MKKPSIEDDLARLFIFVIGLISTFIFINAIRQRRIYFPEAKKYEIAGPDYVATQASDPVLYWVMVVFIGLFSAALLFVAFFGNGKRKH